MIFLRISLVNGTRCFLSLQNLASNISSLILILVINRDVLGGVEMICVLTGAHAGLEWNSTTSRSLSLFLALAERESLSRRHDDSSVRTCRGHLAYIREKRASGILIFFLFL